MCMFVIQKNLKSYLAKMKALYHLVIIVSELYSNLWLYTILKLFTNDGVINY